jgi:hypothetical protein
MKWRATSGRPWIAAKDTFMLDMSAPARGEDLTVLVDKRARPAITYDI